MGLNYPKICRFLLTFSILQYLIGFIFYPTMQESVLCLRTTFPYVLFDWYPCLVVLHLRAIKTCFSNLFFCLYQYPVKKTNQVYGSPIFERINVHIQRYLHEAFNEKNLIFQLLSSRAHVGAQIGQRSRLVAAHFALYQCQKRSGSRL